MKTKQFILKELASLLDVKHIYDVGVNECTIELISVFPASKHFLFELNPFFKEAITKNYADIDHELFLIGLSDVDDSLFLIGTSLENDGKITHTELSNTKSEVDGMKVVQCQECKVKRFDSMKIDVPEGSLLKVDVDGQDLNVIRGAGELINRFSVIIIESVSDKIGQTLSTVASCGFVLHDIADMRYYGPSLYQCDLVFINKKYITSRIKPDIRDFDRSLWKQASEFC